MKLGDPHFKPSAYRDNPHAVLTAKRKVREGRRVFWFVCTDNECIFGCFAQTLGNARAAHAVIRPQCAAAREAA